MAREVTRASFKNGILRVTISVGEEHVEIKSAHDVSWCNAAGVMIGTKKAEQIERSVADNMKTIGVI